MAVSNSGFPAHFPPEFWHQYLSADAPLLIVNSTNFFIIGHLLACATLSTKMALFINNPFRKDSGNIPEMAKTGLEAFRRRSNKLPCVHWLEITSENLLKIGWFSSWFLVSRRRVCINYARQLVDLRHMTKASECKRGYVESLSVDGTSCWHSFLLAYRTVVLIMSIWLHYAPKPCLRLEKYSWVGTTKKWCLMHVAIGQKYLKNISRTKFWEMKFGILNFKIWKNFWKCKWTILQFCTYRSNFIAIGWFLTKLGAVHILRYQRLT